MSFRNIRADGVYPVSNAAERLAFIPATDGLVAVELDTDLLYVWDQPTQTWIPVGGGGPGSGIIALNTLTTSSQSFATGTTGTNFNISSAGSTHTFNFPNASATNRGLLISADWTTFNNKLTTVAVDGVTITGDGTVGNPLVAIGGGSGGITSLNTLTAATQTFATGSSGTDFNINSATSTHTFNIPTASATNRGLLSTTDWTTFNNKLTTVSVDGVTITGDGTPGNPLVAVTGGTGTVTSVDLTVPNPTNPAYSVSGNPITAAGTFAINALGTTADYVRGDGSLAPFPSIGGNSAVSNYFFSNTNADIVGYEYMVCPPPTGSEQVLSDLAPSDAKNLITFVTEVGSPDQIIIPAGEWSVQINASKSGGTNDAQFRFDIYKRDLGGTETLLGSVITPNLTGTNTVYTVSTTIAQQSVLDTDRIVVKVVEVITGGGTDPTSMTLRFEGATGSRFMMPSVCCCPEGGITELTGDVTAGPGSGSQVATLANSGVTAGTYVNATVTFDAKGRATSASNGVVGVGDLVYSDGFDGAVDLDGVNTYSTIMSLSGSTYTLLRSIYTTSFNIDNGITLNTAGHAVYCNGVMTVDGTVGSVGNTASASVAPVSGYGASGGAATISSSSSLDAILIPNPTTGSYTVGAVNVGGQGGGGNTGSGGWGLPGQSIRVDSFLYGGLGGAGGRGTNGSGFTSGSTVTFGAAYKFLPFSFWNGGISNHIGYQAYVTASGQGIRAIVGCPGGGGGAGTNIGSAWGGVGGAGGTSPFGVIIFAKTLTIGASGIIRSNGGNGAAGTTGSGANFTAGSGGGGGGGGIVFIRTTTLNYTPNNQIQALGGQGGASGGFGGGTASAIPSEAGSNGADGYVHIQNINTGICAVYTGQY